MINFLFKCNSKSLHIYIFKTTWKSYFKNNKKISGNLLKNLEKSWKYHGILSSEKVGTLHIEWRQRSKGIFVFTFAFM